MCCLDEANRIYASAEAVAENVMYIGATPIYDSKTGKAIKCQECEACAVQPVVMVENFKLSLYFCSDHHPKLC
jgi:hypothetical protein